MNDIELPAEPETPNPFAGMTAEQIRELTAEQIREYCDRYKGTPGQKARWESQKVVDKLYLEVPQGGLDIVATPTELERRRAMNNSVLHGAQSIAGFRN